jgi:hypothetical protein
MASSIVGKNLQASKVPPPGLTAAKEGSIGTMLAFHPEVFWVSYFHKER